MVDDDCRLGARNSSYYGDDGLGHQTLAHMNQEVSHVDNTDTHLSPRDVDTITRVVSREFHIHSIYSSASS
jgi:hypothetical protein